jgi:two-component system, cell cycle sensor histidine kinase and response regulator CckA
MGIDSQQYHQDIINGIPDAGMIVGRDCRISMVNDALLAMQGDARENIVGKTCYGILHGQDTACKLPKGECPFREVFDFGKKVRVVHRHITRQGKELVVELSGSPLTDAEGNVVGMLEVMRDVTTGLLLEDEKRQSLAFLSSVLEGIGEGVVVMDRDYRILTANKGYLNQVGCGRDQVVGRHCYEVSHHFDSPCTGNGHGCPVRSVFETGNPSRAMHIHFDLQNREIYVECHAYPIKDSKGQVIRAIETLNDVTERVTLEGQLKESEEKYRDLYDHAPDGYYSLADNGLVVEVNRAFLDMLGYRREEVVRIKYIEDLLADASAKICQGKFPEFKKRGRMTNLELILVRKDGSEVPVMMNATAVLNDHGAFVMSRSVVRDITERKQADEEKRKLQEQLFQSQKLEALGTLAGGIAHDFNNLLASIMGYASLSKADLSPDDPLYRNVDIIETASLRASELTQQLLAFAKGGKYDAKPTNVNLIAREVATLLSRTIDKNISLKLKSDNHLRPVLCDAGQIQQALLNICINGRDAMQNGGELTIQTENIHLDVKDVQYFVDVSPGDYVRISVSDTGAGMDRRTQQHMFEPFFTTKEKGTGLGLSLVYGIIKKHNGFIQVDSVPGKGSTFQVNLAACRGEEPGVKTAEHGREARHGSGTILVVDDEKLVAALAGDILRRFGYTVLVAHGGEEAIELYRRRSRDIVAVMLDMVLPGMDGREVFRKLLEMNPDVKVLISSGYSHDRDADDLLRQGAKGFVQKPYRIAELVQAIEDAVGREGRAVS